MTEIEAKEWLANDTSPMKIHTAEMQGENPMEYINSAIEVAIKCMEKQIAKKPRFYAHNYYCKECGNLVGNNEFKWQRFLYCDKCGTKIDWGNEDAE